MTSATKVTDLPLAVQQLYPFEGKRLQVGDGLGMHYLDEGSGPPLLMLHGNPTWSFYYRRLIEAFRPSFRCIVPDHIGCGLSDKPQDWGYRIPDHVDNVVRLIEELDLRDINLVVHDWGGAIGYLAALRMPERFSRFVVFNSAVFLLPLPRTLRMFRIPGAGPLAVRGLNGFLRLGLKAIVAHPEQFTDAVREGYMAPYSSWHDRVAVLRFVQEIPLEKDHPNQRLLRELEGGLHKVKDRPHLIMWGKKDWVFHEAYLQRWRECIPSAQIHEFDDVAHWVVEEAPDRIIPLMDSFLRSSDA